MNSIERVTEVDETWLDFIWEFRNHELSFKNKNDRVFWRSASQELENRGQNANARISRS